MYYTVVQLLFITTGEQQCEYLVYVVDIHHAKCIVSLFVYYSDNTSEHSFD